MLAICVVRVCLMRLCIALTITKHFSDTVDVSCLLMLDVE